MYRFCLAYLGFVVIEWHPSKLVEWNPADSDDILQDFCLNFLKCGAKSQFQGDLLSLMILVIPLAQMTKKLQYTLTITHR